MKKLVIMLSLLLPVAASAQFHVGGQFNINFDNEATNYSSGVAEFKEKEFVVSLRPKIYWYLNDKMQLGGRVGIGFGRLTSGTLYDSESKDKDATNTVNRALGWSLCPFYGYKLVDWEKVRLWVNANVFFGQYYNVGGENKKISEWANLTTYGFQILPVIDIRLKESWFLQLHLGFISLGWAGQTYNYPSKTVVTSSWDMRKGGFDGLLQGFRDYGIGLVKEF